MFEILDRSTSTCIGIRVSGEITADDYEPLLSRIDLALAENEVINLLILVEEFDGWDGLDAAKADYKFGTDEYRHVQRCAFISDKTWHKWVVKLMDPFTRRTDEKFFEPADIDDAWKWACVQP